MDSLTNVQQEICLKFDAHYLPADDYLKVGISKNFNARRFPINGLRHPPQGDTTGWYIWSGEAFSTDPDFFVPLHTIHLSSRCPDIMRYLGLGPGWRFLVAPGQEDIWFDASLLEV
jgi:hypothetical protein